MDLIRLLNRQQSEFHALGNDQLRRLKPIFEQAREELRAEIAALAGRGREDRFTAAQAKRMLAQAEAAVAVIRERLGETLVDGAVKADALAIKHLAEQDLIATQEFGEPPRLDLEGVERLTRDNSLLLERTQSATAPWSERAVAQVRSTLAVGMAKGSSYNDMVKKLTEPGGALEGKRWDAQRLVRTETTHQYNARTLEQMKQQRGALKARKRLLNVLDSRTALDTLQIMAFKDNMVREVDEPFYDPSRNREFQYPPNRPNDRARIVMYYSTPREQAAIAAEQKKAALLRDELEKREALGRSSRKSRTEARQEARQQAASKAAARTLKEGVHVGKIIPGPASPQLVTEVLSVTHRAELAGALRAEPLGSVRFVEQTGISDNKGRPILAYYARREKAIVVPITAAHGERLRPARTQALFRTGRSNQQALQMMFMHETGHHLLERFPEILRLAEAGHSETGVPITVLAASGGPREYFSESLAAFLFHGNVLREVDPIGYAMVEDMYRILKGVK